MWKKNETFFRLCDVWALAVLLINTYTNTYERRAYFDWIFRYFITVFKVFNYLIVLHLFSINEGCKYTHSVHINQFIILVQQLVIKLYNNSFLGGQYAGWNEGFCEIRMKKILRWVDGIRRMPLWSITTYSRASARRTKTTLFNYSFQEVYLFFSQIFSGKSKRLKEIRLEIS